MRALALVFSAVLVLPACGREPTPIEPTATAAAPSSPTGTSKPKPPTLPAAAKRNDETGAANFVLYWVEAFNYAARTGDSVEMRRFAADCKVCTGYADDFDALKPSQRADEPAWAISNVSVLSTGNGYEVHTTVAAASESKKYPLTFVLASRSPFQLEHIYERP